MRNIKVDTCLIEWNLKKRIVAIWIETNRIKWTLDRPNPNSLTINFVLYNRTGKIWQYHTQYYREFTSVDWVSHLFFRCFTRMSSWYKHFNVPNDIQTTKSANSQTRLVTPKCTCLGYFYLYTCQVSLLLLNISLFQKKNVSNWL